MNDPGLGIGLLTWTGIRIQDRNAFLTRPVLEKALFRAIVGGAGQTGQIDQYGHLLGLGLRRQVEVEVHFAAGSGGGVAKLEQLAAKGGDGCFGGDSHVD